MARLTVHIYVVLNEKITRLKCCTLIEPCVNALWLNGLTPPCNSRGSFYGPVKEIPLDVYTIDSDTDGIYVDENVIDDIKDALRGHYTCISIDIIGIGDDLTVTGDADNRFHIDKNINFTEEETYFNMDNYLYIITLTTSISDDLTSITRVPIFVLYYVFSMDSSQYKNIKSLLGRQIKYITDSVDLSNAKKGTITFHYASVEI